MVFRSKVFHVALVGLCAGLPAAAQVFNPALDESLLGAVAGEARAQATCAPNTTAELLPLEEEGALGFRIEGEFLRVQATDLCRDFELPLANNVAYRNVRVEVDVHMNRWTTPLFHNVMSLRRSGRTRNERVLYGGVIIRGDNRKTVLDLGREQQVKSVGSWAPGTTYRLVLEANVPARRVTLSVYDGENLVQQMGGRLTSRDIRSLPGKRVKVDFSSPGVGDHAYFPPNGWTFSNLKVTAVR
ncbi:MAG TPA: hypothetical protein VHN15_11170 [Thermoanaerobaculia bacterium]|nr:hypothetical protein [Thermoanaerobaculia bacterium]